MTDFRVIGLKRDQTGNQLEHPGMSPVFASDEKYNLCLSFTHTHTHTSNICLECSGGHCCKGDGKLSEGRQGRERRGEGGTEGKGISGRNMNGRGRGEGTRGDGHGE